MLNEITMSECILSLIAVCGEFPVDQLSRLRGGEQYKLKVIKQLKKQKLIKTFYKDRLRGYRLRLPAKEIMLCDNPNRFSFYLTGSSETNHLKSEYTRRLRLHRTAETWITMLNAAVSILRDEKTNIFSPEWRENDVTPPAFYSSIEIKEMGRCMTKISSSRAIGVLLTDENIYATYSLGDSLMKWPYKAEMRFKVMMMNVFCHERLRYSKDNLCGLLLANSFSLVGEIFRQSRNNLYFLLEEGYEHFYFLTNDHKGECVLRLLCDKLLLFYVTFKTAPSVIEKTRSKLSIIARQGRAFGIHLILATQRPDATILSGQIRNNIDCRVCGRADNVVSQIILDSTAAAEQIPKDAAGRFMCMMGR